LSPDGSLSLGLLGVETTDLKIRGRNRELDYDISQRKSDE
jgi:hypothetical protein